MKCRDVAPLIYLIREGELSAEERQNLDNHLATCQACTKEYESVRQMSALMQAARPVMLRPKAGIITDAEILHALERSMGPGAGVTRSMRPVTLFKGIAATLLVAIASTLIFQETVFYRYQSSIKGRLHQAAVQGTGEMETTDCLTRLKKVYRMGSLGSFAGINQVAVNTISEDQLRIIVDQVCGSTSADISTVKKLMIQSGLRKSTSNND